MIDFLKGIFGSNNAAAGYGQQVTTTAAPPSPPANPYPFSNDDEIRLQELQTEWQQQIKEHKIKAFKCLNQNVRQHIIDSIEFYAAIATLNAPYDMPQMPPAMQYLLDKKELHLMGTRNNWGRPLNLRHDFMQHAHMPQFKIHASNFSFIDMENHFCGLTLGDLIKAHTDVTVDEEVLGDKP